MSPVSRILFAPMPRALRLTNLISIATFLFLLPLAISALDLDSVTISGKVTDQNGAVVPGASITATLVTTKIERTTVANGDGNYKLIQLAPGVYNIKASFASFATEEKTNLTTIAAQNVQLDFVL